jgi:hypothetical protein
MSQCPRSAWTARRRLLTSVFVKAQLQLNSGRCDPHAVDYYSVLGLHVDNILALPKTVLLTPLCLHAADGEALPGNPERDGQRTDAPRPHHGPPD